MDFLEGQLFVILSAMFFFELRFMVIHFHINLVLEELLKYSRLNF